MINEDFEYYFEKNGAPEPVNPVSAAEIAALSQNMPPQYAQLLERYGEFTQRNHMFKFIRTDRLHSLADMIFEGDRDLGDGKVFVFGFSIFGTLWFWHPTFGIGSVDLVTGNVSCYGVTDPGEPVAPDLFHGEFDVPFSLENESYDLFDEADKPLFKRALKKLGAPEFMECYGFVPALAFGGEAVLENLKKLSAPEHFAILAQATEFTLTKSEDYGEMTEVRVIGR